VFVLNISFLFHAENDNYRQLTSKENIDRLYTYIMLKAP